MNIYLPYYGNGPLGYFDGEKVKETGKAVLFELKPSAERPTKATKLWLPKCFLTFEKDVDGRTDCCQIKKGFLFAEGYQSAVLDNCVFAAA